MERMVVALRETTTKYYALTDEDEAKVRAYAEEYGISFKQAVRRLDEKCEIDIWAHGDVDENQDGYAITGVGFREVKW